MISRRKLLTAIALAPASLVTASIVEDGLHSCAIRVFRIDTVRAIASFQFTHELTRPRILLGCFLKDINGKLLSVGDNGEGHELGAGGSISLTMTIDLKEKTIIKVPTEDQAVEHACLEYGQMI